MFMGKIILCIRKLLEQDNNTWYLLKIVSWNKKAFFKNSVFGSLFFLCYKW